MTSDLLFETVPSVSLAISTIHFMTYFFCFCYMLISVFTVWFYPCFLSYFNCSWALPTTSLDIFFTNTEHSDRMRTAVSSYCWYLPSVSVCNIFVAWYLVCNTWSCVAIISLSVSAFRSFHYIHMNVISSLTSFRSVLLIYCPCCTSLSFF
jgi:hypothetical protein